MKSRLTRQIAKGAIGLLLIVGLGAAIHWRGAFNPLAIRDAIVGHPAAPLVFILLHVLASLFFVPRTLLGIAAGLIWGLWWGIILALGGGLAGALAGFLVARYLNGGLLRPEKIPGIGRFLQRMEGGGWRVVAFCRLMPVMPHTPVNYAFGLTQIGVGSYFMGTLIGLLPSTVFAVDVGVAGQGAATGSGHWLVPSLIGLAALAVSLLTPRFFRARDLRQARG